MIAPDFIRIVKIFLIVMCFYAYKATAFDYGTNKNILWYANNATFVVIGHFEKLPESKKINYSIDHEQYYLNGFRVNKLFKGQRVKAVRLPLRLPIVYRLLDQPEELTKARMEKRRLSGCKSQLKGTFKRHPNDKTYCESTIDEINQKLNVDGFRQQALLGYFLERGWNLSFDKKQQYLAFLEEDEQGVFYFKDPFRFIPIGEGDLEEVQKLLKMEEL